MSYRTEETKKGGAGKPGENPREPKFYATPQKVIHKMVHQEKVYAKFKGKSLSERYICMCSCIVSYIRNLFYLRYW
jgi:hypothetical protein